MGCCSPNSVGPGATAPESCKRVNYTLGMLLGVDDFVQESTYNVARRHELARELLGYGTVHGLQVIVEPDGDKGPRLRVMPGLAWLPSGQPVCVDSPQCANLNDWLTTHADQVEGELSGSPPSAPRLRLYLVLSYAQCLTDKVPIPGEPCRDESELMQPSRITDGFRLDLRLAKPPQHEEDATRDFVAWLVRQPLAESSPPLDEKDLIERLREAARDWLSPTSPPTSPPDYLLGAAPAGTSEALFFAALRLWATELRPLWMARADCGCKVPPIPPHDDAVLLAELRVDLVATTGGGGWRVSDVEPAVELDESRRPVLLNLRMVQELITRYPSPDPGETVVAETAFDLAPDAGVALGYARADHSHGSPALPELGGDLSGPIEAAWIERLQGVPLVGGSPLVDGQVLTVEAGQWVAQEPDLPDPGNGVVAEQSFGLPTDVGVSLAYARADHTHGSPPLPAAGGDLSGTIDAARIERLQGIPLVSGSPLADGQVLMVDGGEWVARALPAAPAPGGDFVGRGAQPYEIVAAGEVELRLDNRVGMPGMLSSYGRLQAMEASASDLRRAEVRFRAEPRDLGQLENYIVKLTPVWSADTMFGFRLFLLDGVLFEAEFIEFSVGLLADEQIVDGEFAFRFQIEVSRFGEEA